MEVIEVDLMTARERRELKRMEEAANFPRLPTIKILGYRSPQFECRCCGVWWSPIMASGGKFRRGALVCHSCGMRHRNQPASRWQKELEG